MNNEQHLLACLAEECAEVIKEVNKAFRFGLDDHNPNDPDQITTRKKIEAEIRDIISIVHMLSDTGTLTSVRSDMSEHIIKKQAKVTKYMDYARNNGTLE